MYKKLLASAKATIKKITIGDYPDKYWREAYQTALGRSKVNCVVGPLNFKNSNIIEYENIDYQTNADMLILHKDHHGAFPTFYYEKISQGAVVFENRVFIVVDLNSKAPSDDLAKFRESSKRQTSLTYFMHIPKTAGTSIFHQLRRNVPGCIYYGKRQDLKNAKLLTQRNIVAGHFYLDDIVVPNDRPIDVFTVLRHPVERFLSAVAHARRPAENVDVFGPSMRAMRGLPLPEYMETKYASVEIRQLSIFLGEKPGLGMSPDEARTAGIENIREGRILAFDAHSLDKLQTYLTSRFKNDFEIGHRNISSNKYKYFSSDELDFIVREIPRLFVDEVQFYEEAVSTGDMK